MENFFKIRADKQEHIINAAFLVFGRQGYRKASVADIAQEAGITKGMITYYFGSKRTLYLYLVEAIQTRLVQAVRERLSPEITDFFEKLKIAADIQVNAIKEYPALINFMNSLYYETDPEVTGDLEQAFADVQARFSRILLEEADFSRFKPGCGPRLLCKFVLWASDGFMTELYEAGAEKIDALAAEFYQCLDFIQKNFYREDIC